MGRGRRRSDRNQFLARLDKAPGGFGVFEPEQGTAGGENEIDPGRNERLMLAVDFAQPAFGAVAMHGIAHGGAGGDDTHAGIGRRAGGPDAPSQQKNTAIDPATLLANGAEIGVAPQALTGGQAQGWARCSGHAVLFKRP